MRLRLLSAECSGRLGDLERAGYDLVAAWSEDPEPSLELVAESNRVVGELLTIQGDGRGAAAAVKRARRVLMAIGHAHDAARLTAVQAGDESGPRCVRSEGMSGLHEPLHSSTKRAGQISLGKSL